MTSPELEIVWADGSLDLLGFNDTSYGEVLIQALSDGTEWGNPESVRRALFSALADGSASALERHENRTITIKLRLTAADSVALAGGEAPLHMLSGMERAELRWTPPNDFAAPAVFTIVASDLTHQMDDLAENRVQRFYTLTLVCRPFAVSADYVTIPALVVGSSAPTLIDACASLTGWTASDATLGLAGSTITATAASATTSFVVTRTGAVDFTASRYLSVLASLRTGGTPVKAEALISGVWTVAPAVGVDAGASIFDVGAVSTTALRLTFSKPPGSILNNNGGVWATLDNLNRQSTPRSTASRQQTRSVEIPGSARTAASIHISSPTAGLGTTILYTGPAYDPSLSRGSTTSRTTAGTNVSGGVNTLTTPGTVAYRLPASTFSDGSYTIWARVAPIASTTTGTIEALVTLRDAAGVQLSQEQFGTVSVTGPGLALKLLGVTDLPTAALPPGSAATVDISLSWTATPGLPLGPDRGLLVDEAWAFNRSQGDLTIVEAGSERDVWIDAPSLESPAPAVFIGTGAKATARPASLATELLSWPGTHRITPPIGYVYGATFNVADATIVENFRPAWHTHPAA